MARQGLSAAAPALLPLLLLALSPWALPGPGTQAVQLASLSRKKVLGSGATTALPFLSARTQHINQKYSTSIKYSGVGSGAGRQQFTASATLFCSTDVPMSVSEETLLRGSVKFTMPMAIQTITLFTNLPGRIQVRLTAPVVAKIFSRKITKWNHPQIVALNRKLSMPNKPITVFVRRDSSGSTALVTQWLQRGAGGVWKLGSGGQISWPRGVVQVDLTSGVLGKLAQSKYGIGYASTAAGIAVGLREVSLRNKGGRFVEASTADVKGAIPRNPPPATGSWASVSLVLGPGPRTWPITSFSYLLARKNQYQNGAPAGILKAWLKYLFSANMQALYPKYDFSPCPASVLSKNIAAVNSMQIIAGTAVPKFT